MPRLLVHAVVLSILVGSAASSGDTLLEPPRAAGGGGVPGLAAGAGFEPLAAALPAPRCAYDQGSQRVELDAVPGLFALGHARELPLPAEPLVLSSSPGEIGLTNAVPGVWRGALRPKGRGRLSGTGSTEPAESPGLEVLRRAIREERPEIQWIHAALRSRRDGGLLLPTPRLVVKLRPGTPGDVAERFPGARSLRPLRLAQRQFLLELTDLSEHPCDAADRLRALPWVEWVEPDFVQQIELLSTPNDPLFGDYQWNLANTGQGGGTPGADARLPVAWDHEVGDDSVVIAVVDDGVELAHPDLSGQIFVNTLEPVDGADNDGNGYIDDRFGWDFFDDDNDANPTLTGPGSHGTAVAGVAAATGDNALGITGACQSCRILPVRAFSDTEFATASTLAEATLYAGNFSRILNNSWFTPPAAVLTDAIDAVATLGSGGLGTPVVCSAGNQASGYVWWWVEPGAAGTYTFEWVFEKNGSVSAGFDRAWLDSVLFPDGSSEAFDACTALPDGWTSTGDLPWSALADEARAGSFDGEGCALVSGAIGHDQISAVRVTRTIATVGKIWYQVWVSAEKNAPGGVGYLVQDDRQGDPECYDFTYLNVYDAAQTLIHQGNFHCGTWTPAGPLEEGTLTYPASLPNALAVGASTDGDRRAYYSQWGPELDLVAPSGGGRSYVATTDIVGASGYQPTDYVTVTGTSFAAPLVSGILGLLLTDQPGLELGEVRERLRWATRKIGTEPYAGGRNDHYGWGVISAELLLTQLLIDDFETGGLTLWSNH